jgi:hypothetical protein
MWFKRSCVKFGVLMLEENLLTYKKVSNCLNSSEGLDLCCDCYPEQIESQQWPILTGYFSEVPGSFTQSQDEYFMFDHYCCFRSSYLTPFIIIFVTRDIYKAV